MSAPEESPVAIIEEPPVVTPPPQPTIADELRKLAEEAHEKVFTTIKNELLESLRTNAQAGNNGHVHHLDSLPATQVLQKLQNYFNGEGVQFTVHRSSGEKGFLKVIFNF